MCMSLPPPAGQGILHCGEFCGLQWDTGDGCAPLADILRVHEWAYVRGLQRASAALPDDPAVVGRLDADTAISSGTYRAALVAAGAVCRAVDAVMAGKVGHIPAVCAHRATTGLKSQLKVSVGEGQRSVKFAVTTVR